MKQEKGITIIALVVTVVVLLIITAVTLKTALGGGMLTTRNRAQEELKTEISNTEKQKNSIQDQWGNYLRDTKIELEL